MTTVEHFKIELDGEVQIDTEWTVHAVGDPERGWIVQEATLETLSVYINPEQGEDEQIIYLDRTAEFRRIMGTVEGRWDRLHELLAMQLDKDIEGAREWAEFRKAREAGVD